MQSKIHLNVAVKRLMVAVLLLFVVGCAYEPVKPWHRDVLSQDSAQLVPDTLENESDEHIYFSKEAAKGGQGVGGGGCGCN